MARCSRQPYRNLLIPSLPTLAFDEHVGEPASWADFVPAGREKLAFGAGVDAFHIAALANAVSMPGENGHHGVLATKSAPCRPHKTEKTQADQHIAFHPCAVRACVTLDIAKHEMAAFHLVMGVVAAVDVVAFDLGGTCCVPAVDFVASVEIAGVSPSVAAELLDCPHSQSFDTATAAKRPLPKVTSPSTHLLQDSGQSRKSCGPGSSLLAEEAC